MSEDRIRSLFAHLSAFEVVLFLLGSGVFLFLLVEVQPSLGPVLLGLTVAVLVWPLRHRKTVRALLITTGLLVILWLLLAVGMVLAPFVVAYVLAYVMEPGVTWSEKRGVPRWAASLAMTLLVVGALVLVFVLILPQLFGQVQQLANRLVELGTQLPELLRDNAFLNRLAEEGWIDRAAIEARVTEFASSRMTALAEQVPELLRHVMQSVSSVLAVVTILAVFPVVFFYCLRDFSSISRHLARLLPTYRGERRYLQTVDEIAGSYIRGQLLICLIAAVNVGFWLSVLGVPFALLLGVIAGVLNLIPQIGAILTNIVASLIAVAFGEPWLLKLAYVQAVLLGQSVLETTVLTPNIMSAQVGLHPILVILVVFVFGALLGVLGFIIAVPVTALLVALYVAFKDRFSFDLARYSEPPDEAGT